MRQISDRGADNVHDSHAYHRGQVAQRRGDGDSKLIRVQDPVRACNGGQFNPQTATVTATARSVRAIS